MSTDLFETPELLPAELDAIFNRYSDDFENGDPYVVCKEALSEIEPLGYTFDYGLDGVPYDLRKIG